jgi:hypothetical protein
VSAKVRPTRTDAINLARHGAVVSYIPCKVADALDERVAMACRGAAKGDRVCQRLFDGAIASVSCSSANRGRHFSHRAPMRRRCRAGVTCSQVGTNDAPPERTAPHRVGEPLVLRTRIDSRRSREHAELCARQSVRVRLRPSAFGCSGQPTSLAPTQPARWSARQTGWRPESNPTRSSRCLSRRALHH